MTTGAFTSDMSALRCVKEVEPVSAKTAAALTRVIRDAARYVPFYRKHWSGAGIDFDQFDAARDLRCLPTLCKADLLASAPEDRIDARFAGQRVVAEPTSGSTGVPFAMPIDKRSHRRRRLRFLKALMGVGYFPGRRLMLISNPPYPAGAKFLRWTYADLRRGEVDVFEVYARTRPDVLYGPLSSLLILARRIAESPTKVRPPKVVVSTAEQLRSAQRDFLSAAFGTGVADFYGMTELGLVAFSQPNGGDYRAMSDHLHLEYLPADAGSNLEHLIVTDLGGGVMPLIRFDTGDLVKRDHGRKGSPIVLFSGREVDCLKRPDGGWVSPYEITVALDLVPGIRQYQVVQRSDLTIDLYVTAVDADPATAMDSACRVLRMVCGEAARVEVHARAEQPLVPGRKQRTVCSEATA
jgi:phenylacetate-CoA ligase